MYHHTGMTEQPSTNEAEHVKEILDRTVQELNRRTTANPVAPAADDDGVPTYEMPPENQVPPEQLPDDVKQQLGVKI